MAETRFPTEWKAVNLDHDYAPDVLKKRKEYAEIKAVLKEKKIRFQTPFPAKLRVHYEGGPVLYGTTEEATSDMIKRGYAVAAVNTPNPTSLLEQIQHLSWRT
ncbi:hypothetical protein WMY93_022014 [Mugilogobius chulae]|uniref:Uncharacterized protein n=1 Tax=Mugilogobius chulae TaxID=88201 RepID=A0AAW0NMA6_9GOBI